MAEEEKAGKKVVINKTINRGMSGGCGGIYFFGFLGALVYYFQQNPKTFMDGLIAVLKSIAWPGMVVFKVFQLLKL